ncbi:MAG: ATP-binding protein [Lewinellaceae bacterium]|nr:ATP-binding protein [Lewinellaceae bacterium]
MTYEDINNHFQSDERDARMMEFVSPLSESETMLSVIASNITTAGKLTFILGHPGVGKSTFLHTLNWRSHIPIRKVIDLDANSFNDGESLDGLYNEIHRICGNETDRNDKGICAILINYLEYVDEYPDSTVKGFFRKLNGLLRNKPVLILWPVINENDVQRMIEFSQHVSGTLYQRDRKVVNITGPKKSEYIDIAKRTIKVLNNGAELSDFGLTNDDLVEIYNEFIQLPIIDQNIREYYSRIVSKWELSSKYLEELKLKIPKPTEVWFIFPFKEAEAVVNQFSRKGNRVEDAWTAVTDKFSDYINGNTQRASKWDSTRLNLALHGALKSRIMYIPTNLVITTSAAFSNNPELIKIISDHNPPSHWNKKYQTKISIERSPVYKQLINEQFPTGKRKGGPVVQALETANPIYKDIVAWVSGSGSGSDTYLNKAFASALEEAGVNNVSVEKEHPWIKSVFPDIQIDLGHKIVCLEFHYTFQDEPHIIADYCLKKLDIYMNQMGKMI